MEVQMIDGLARMWTARVEHVDSVCGDGAGQASGYPLDEQHDLLQCFS